MKRWVFAKMCRIIYKKDERIFEELEKMGFEKSNIKIITSDSHKALIIKSGARQYVVFKGSSSLDEWAADFLFYPVKMAGKEIRVHAGFYMITAKLWLEMGNLISKDLYTTFIGHSLGAAIAQLMAIKTYSAGHLKIREVLAFASPRVGLSDYAEYCERLPFKITRFQNNMDIVCDLPPTSIGYREVGELVYIDRNGKITENPSKISMLYDQAMCYATFKWKELATDHKIQQYLDALKGADY